MPTDTTETFPVPIPYNLKAGELLLEADTNDAEWFSELSWLQANANDDEAARILTAAVLLWHRYYGDTEPPTLGDCLFSAIVMERG